MPAIEIMKSISWSQHVIGLCNDHPSITVKSQMWLEGFHCIVLPHLLIATPTAHYHCIGPMFEYYASSKVMIIDVTQYDYCVFVWNSHTDEDYC